MAGRKIALLVFFFCATAFGASEIDGHWRYIGYRYQEKNFPPANPDLVLTFTFSQDGTDRLRWSRTNEEGSCEREALFDFKNETLNELVTWVSPKNSAECGRDPDMQLGKKSSSPARVRDGVLEIDLFLDDETLTYLWKKEAL